MHLVTVPHPGAPRDLLWQRFCGVFGIDPASLTEGTNRENQSLGVPETALVRRLNERLQDVLPNERYRQFVREHLVHQTLSRGQTSARLSVPPDVYAWAAGVSREWRDAIAARGYDVVGDLDELLAARARCRGSTPTGRTRSRSPRSASRDSTRWCARRPGSATSRSSCTG